MRQRLRGAAWSRGAAWPGAFRRALRARWGGLFGIALTLACLELIEILAATPLRVGAPGSLIQLVAVVAAALWGARWGLASAALGVAYQFLHLSDAASVARLSTSAWTIPASAALVGWLRTRALLAVAVREAARRAEIIESAMDAVVSVDAAGRVAVWNRMAEQMFGVPAAEALGGSLDRFIPPEARGRHREHLRRFGSTGQTARRMGGARGTERGGMSLHGVRADGDRFPIEASISRVETADGPLLTAIIRDVTERERLDRIQQEFLGLAAHELKNPLAALRASAQLLERKREYIPGTVRVLVEQTRRLERLVNDLLDVSRLEGGRLRLRTEPTDLARVVREVMRATETRADGRRIAVEAPERLVGHWDEDRLVQILTNLLANALTYAPDGAVTIRLETAGDRALLSVSDRGPGIAAEDQARLFERFFRPAAGQQASQHGLGLGLHISRSIARAHGGDLHVDSTPGRGSTFTLELPISARPPSGDIGPPAGRDP